MTAFRILLVVQFACLSIYTGVVAYTHGFILFDVFFSDMVALAWPGQFNLDFSCLLLLSGLWVAWRHGFSVTGVVLGLAAGLLGAMFLTVYLLTATWIAKGDVEALLLGPIRRKA